MSRRLNLWFLLLAVVCGLSYWFGRGHGRQAEAVATTPAVSPVPETAVSRVPDEQPVHLLVLNGTARKNLAGEFRLLLGRAGLVAEDVGNAPRADFDRSLLVNRRLAAGQARDLAARLGGVPVVREWDGRGTEDAVLVLGADHAELRRRLLEGIVAAQRN